MLGKLLKYEIKATARLFLPLYLTVLVVAALNMLFLNVPDAGSKSFSFSNLAMGISMVAYVSLIVGMLLMTLIVLIQRFYKNLLSDEGYLMFTLPVASWSHILSKLTVSMLWTIVSGIVAVISVLVLAANDISIAEVYNGLSMVYDQFTHYFGAYGFLLGFEAVVLALLTIASTILTIYAAIALGHLFNKYKLLASFGMYIVLKTASQVLMTILAAIFFNMPSLGFVGNSIPNALQVNNFMLLSIFYSAILTAAYFILTNYILKRKLNLE